ncbi:MAG: hypothetical protein JRI23_23015 [Deltaproteobacteria bacterium]|nr:hypothetical protein [Deltaproteobacteria bacterium]MBW2534843.1 hypothetical protein [Deltaproteobacteria bacterium]
MGTALALLLGSSSARAEPEPEPEPDAEPFVQVRGVGEIGGLFVLGHTVQLSKSGTVFDYRADGGQDVFFPFGRLSAELELNGHHTFILLYQPLDLRTREVLHRDVVADGLRFPAGTALDLRYFFDFYRFSYLYDFWGDRAHDEFSWGLTLQIRNAIIDFTSADGELSRTRSNIGPVPAIKARMRHTFDCGAWIGGEADGMYAPVKYINGGDSDVEGAILDISLRAGYVVTPSVDVFLNLRQLAGGAEGTGSPTAQSDGFTANWLNFFIPSVGVIWTPTAGL